jgi:thioesterase domain-containing protein
VISYSQLARCLGPEQPVYGFQQLRPVTDAGVSPASVEAMAASYLEELLRLRSAGPLLLAGYSFGGIGAFEMAQQLMAKGYRVALLAVIDEYAPDPTILECASGRWMFAELSLLAAI